MKRRRWETKTICNNFYHIMKAYAFSLGSESCTRSLHGENSLSLGLPGAAGSPAGGRGRERSAAPSPGTPHEHGRRGAEGRAPPPERSAWALSAASRPRPAPPGRGSAEPAGPSGAVRGSGEIGRAHV